MRQLLIATAAAVLLVPDLCAQRGDRDGRGRPGGEAAPVALKAFDFKEAQFTTKNLTEGSGRYGIYLPKGWDAEANKDKKYPWIVWLHGFGGYREFQTDGGASTLDALRSSGELPELVLVTFVAPGGRRGRSVYVNGEASGKIEDAIVQDLVAQVQKDYPVADRREQRAIMGISIGGFAALKIALRHPDVFGAVGAHSSAIFPDDPKKLPPEYEGQVGRALQQGLAAVFGDPIDPAKWAAEMPMGLVRNAGKDKFAKLRIYFDAGSEDRYGFAKPNQELSKLMTEKGIEHTFRLVQGGGHAWGSPSMLENLKASLKFVAAAVAGKEPAPKDAGAQPGK
jgi:enterochelin esterase-like enzyme